MVEILEETNLIRVGLELPDADEAVAIVQAVVQSYLAQNKDYSRNANRDQTEQLKQQLTKLAHDIDEKKVVLKALVQSGKIAVLKPGEFLNTKNDRDASQPALRKVTENLLQQMIQRDDTHAISS